MMNEHTTQTDNHTDEHDIFPSFPAPRVWNLGWECDAFSGNVHEESTADFLSAATSEIAITIIRPHVRH